MSSDKSKQPSYKEWLLWVIKEFDYDEFKAYVSKLEVFKKNTIKLTNSCALADQAFKQWDEEMVKLYNDNDMKLPTASVKTGGIVSDFISFIQKGFARVINGIQNLIGSLSSSTRDMSQSILKLEKINDSWTRN